MSSAPTPIVNARGRLWPDDDIHRTAIAMEEELGITDVSALAAAEAVAIGKRHGLLYDHVELHELTWVGYYEVPDGNGGVPKTHGRIWSYESVPGGKDIAAIVLEDATTYTRQLDAEGELEPMLDSQGFETSKAVEAQLRWERGTDHEQHSQGADQASRSEGNAIAYCTGCGRIRFGGRPPKDPARCLCGAVGLTDRPPTRWSTHDGQHHEALIDGARVSVDFATEPDAEGLAAVKDVVLYAHAELNGHRVRRLELDAGGGRRGHDVDRVAPAPLGIFLPETKAGPIRRWLDRRATRRRKAYAGTSSAAQRSHARRYGVTTPNTGTPETGPGTSYSLLGYLISIVTGYSVGVALAIEGLNVWTWIYSGVACTGALAITLALIRVDRRATAHEEDDGA